MSTRLTSAEFARHAGISDQKARRALARALLGKTWRGALLAVELVHGRGGDGGGQYVVRLDSLPAELQQRSVALRPATLPALDGPCPEATRRLNIIGPIVAHPPRSDARRAAFAAVLIAHPKLTERTLQRWLNIYAALGVAGLARRPRRDKGTRRALISALWFAEASKQLDAAAMEKIDTALSMRIRSQYANARETFKYMQSTASMTLCKITSEAGFVVTGETPKRMFDVPRAYILRQRQWHRRARIQLDAKAEHDQRPAIRRKLADRPNLVVDIDAMHFDTLVSRADGTTATPKAIVFTDRATNQARVYCFLLAQGEGLSQHHVAMAIVADIETHGVAETYYIDNGREFAALCDLADIIQCVAQVERGSGIIHARPYGARAKSVETIIGVLQKWFMGLPGYLGNNRINRKTQQVGRPTTPFPGTFQEFTTTVALRVRMYNASAQRGKLRGRSPDDVLQEHIERDTFQRYGVDRASLWLAFSKRATRIVKPYGIHVGGRWWTCDALSARGGETVGILEGRFYDWPVIPLYDLTDPKTIIDYAEPHDAVDGLDPANAREQRRREKLYIARGRELIASAGPYDPIADTHAMTALLPPPPVAPIAGTIVPNEQAAEIVAKVAEHPAARNRRGQANAVEEQNRLSERSARRHARLQKLSNEGRGNDR